MWVQCLPMGTKWQCMPMGMKVQHSGHMSAMTLKFPFSMFQRLNQHRSHGPIFLILEDTSLFCGATDSPVLDVWCRLPGFQTRFIACFDSEAFMTHILQHISTSIGNWEPTIECATEWHSTLTILSHSRLDWTHKIEFSLHFYFYAYVVRREGTVFTGVCSQRGGREYPISIP